MLGRLQRTVRRIVATAPTGKLLWSLFAAALVGALPFLLALFTGLSGHHLVAALLTAWLCWGYAQNDRFASAMCVMAVAFVVHCALVITCSALDPTATAAILPDAEDYWQKQVRWIVTGADPEYELSVWIPSHLLLCVATIVMSLMSLGVLTLERGFYEVDLMNYYNGQLWQASHNGPLALLLGWHVWSLLRGIGYLFLTYEGISLGIQLWTGVESAPWSRRAARWGLGFAFLLADGVAKFWLLEPVRASLAANFNP